MIEPVDKFLAEAEVKPVKVYLYSYYDKALDKFNMPQVEDKEPEFMSNAIRAGLIKGTFKPEQAKGLIFVFLGTFCIDTGEFDLLEKAQIVVDCDSVLNTKEDNKLDA